MLLGFLFLDHLQELRELLFKYLGLKGEAEEVVEGLKEGCLLRGGDMPQTRKGTLDERWNNSVERGEKHVTDHSWGY
jgi:hypothetical protein